MNYETKYASIKDALKKYGMKSLDEAKAVCDEAGINVEEIVKGIQPICFDNAIAIKSGAKNSTEVALKIGEGLQAFCVKGSVADERQIGIGHGRLASMLLDEKTKSFAFLAGH